MNSIKNNLSDIKIGSFYKFKKIIVAILKLVGVYILLSFILMLINPLFGYIVFAPLFFIQSIINPINESIIKNKQDKIPTIQTNLPSTLNYSDCRGNATSRFVSQDVGRSLRIIDRGDEKIIKYLDQLGVSLKGDPLPISYCKTSNGVFLLKFSNAWGNKTDIYKDNSGELVKIFSTNSSSISLLESNENRLFISIDSFNPSLYEFFAETNSFKRVLDTQTPDINFCEKEPNGLNDQYGQNTQCLNKVAN